MLRKLKAKISTYFYQKKLKNTDRKDIFTDYYRKNFWSNPESFSGSGSTLEYTENIRKEIPRVIGQFGVKTFLDAPCGDYNWFRYVERAPDVSYIGGDIVPDLIERNNKLYANENTRFMQLDVIADDLPAADIWLCRDALFHFSTDDIFRTLRNFVKSDIKYLFTTTHTECTVNTDILTGDFRLVNLQLPPFNFPEPALFIDDWIDGFHVRKVGLWEKVAIERVLADRPD